MFSVSDIAQATGGRIIGDPVARAAGVSTDSRKVGKGELFVALVGDRFDGHDFVPQVAGQGGRLFLVEERWLGAHALPNGSSAVAVADTLKALGDLAGWHRRRFRIPVVAVTGSNGKTTTKEMLSCIMALSGQGLKTLGNLNNLIGLPLTLLGLTHRHRWAVVELGMSAFGEIDRLAEIAGPDVGIITNAFPAHLETLGSVEGVAKAKGELFLRLAPRAWAVYNVDDPRISRLPIPLDVQSLSFGLRGAEVSSASVRSLGTKGESFTLRLPDREIPVKLKAFGKHNVYNALAAAAAAHALGISAEQIQRGLEEFVPYDKRFQVEDVSGIVLVDDSYNANPASMAAGLGTLKEMGIPGRLCAALGDMLELGEGSELAHRDLGKVAAKSVERLYLIGAQAEQVRRGALEGGLAPENVILVQDHDELCKDLLSWLRQGDCIFVKGSRGMQMERVARAVREAFGGTN
ncbi:UDP-N-acetylmuramoyl-tripeptide--D-alanyl-D-alanine ligase [Geomesophilobacter sediminis]|uniref:UDP-N-acetylmuramoyl-tripeptide--D-alanyl-D-alanine ligase n=1 Tax=Geomesophilobacter sediminis TaxID=2798584 RepID=A0A8J7M126_9BACT|nr:UDP-N-acetylmuramoyl-tripeptide--D-alanyl-D-alanine ligase [Geomesophilobacter sediminis]MBJ6726664.1 UDP-N-acetylmuramoyl-tripeptide--D-alanyl-D-alanine ligase [Geomesophilobacter sediminis]